jgi:hypothetical protein
MFESVLLLEEIIRFRYSKSGHHETQGFDRENCVRRVFGDEDVFTMHWPVLHAKIFL